MKTITSLLCLGLLCFFSYGQQKNDLSDPEVASVAVTANQIDIEYANIALKKSSDKQIKEFANTMATDHKAIIDQAVALAKKLGVTPKDNSVSKSLMEGAKKMQEKLNKTSKKDFDKVYIDNEVAYHKAVISTVQDILIPDTENSELKQLLEAVLPALQVHLRHAEMIQSQMNKK